jgi:hypothetical protein
LIAVVEALTLALADRERYYGDARFVDMPLAHLLDDEFARMRRGLIRNDRLFPGMPPVGALGRSGGTFAAKIASGLSGSTSSTKLQISPSYDTCLRALRHRQHTIRQYGWGIGMSNWTKTLMNYRRGLSGSPPSAS